MRVIQKVAQNLIPLPGDYNKLFKSLPNLYPFPPLIHAMIDENGMKEWKGKIS